MKKALCYLLLLAVLLNIGMPAVSEGLDIEYDDGTVTEWVAEPTPEPMPVVYDEPLIIEDRAALVEEVYGVPAAVVLNDLGMTLEDLDAMSAADFDALLDPIGMMSANAPAAAELCGEATVWALSGTAGAYTLTISGTGAMSGAYTAPADVPWYASREEIVAVVVEKGVESVSAYAFADCVNLRSVALADTVKEIGAKAFLNCAALETVEIPANAKVADDAFTGCDKLVSDTLAVASFDASIAAVAVPATAIAVSADRLNAFVGETVQMTATLTPTNSTTAVTWTSNHPEIATVDANGLVTAVGAGRVSITGRTANGLKASKVLTISERGTMTLPDTDIAVTKYLKIAPVFEPAGAASTVTSWSSSDTSIVTVDTTGKLYGVSVGTASVTATAANGLTATCTVTVKPLPTSVTISARTVLLEPDGTYQMSATVAPADSYDVVTWTTNNASIATVDSTGLISAVGIGRASITARTINGKKISCVVTVGILPTSLDATADVTTVPAGTRVHMSYTILPENTTSKVTWTSNHEDIATVDSKGNVTTIKPGRVAITARTDNSLKKLVVITVTQGVTALSLPETQTYSVGRTMLLTPTLEPADLGTVVLWSSSDPTVATVDSTGRVKCLTAGTTVITASTTTGLTAECVVYAKTAPTAVTLDATTATAYVGVPMTLTATVTPEDALDTITWSSNHPEIATVDKNGVVTPVAVGKVLITAKTANGLKVNCVVTVSAPLSYEFDLTLPESICVYEDAVFTVVKSGWTDAAVITVNDTTVTPDANGEFTLSFTETGSYDLTVVVTEGSKTETFEYTVTVGDTVTLNGIIYKLADSKAHVIGCSSTAADLTVADAVYGCTTVAVDESAFEGITTLVSINLPDSITVIGKRAFAGCTSLSSMNA